MSGFIRREIMNLTRRIMRTDELSRIIPNISISMNMKSMYGIWNQLVDCSSNTRKATTRKVLYRSVNRRVQASSMKSADTNRRWKKSRASRGSIRSRTIVLKSKNSLAQDGCMYSIKANRSEETWSHDTRTNKENGEEEGGGRRRRRKKKKRQRQGKEIEHCICAKDSHESTNLQNSSTHYEEQSSDLSCSAQQGNKIHFAAKGKNVEQKNQKEKTFRRKFHITQEWARRRRRRRRERELNLRSIQ